MTGQRPPLSVWVLVALVLALGVVGAVALLGPNLGTRRSGSAALEPATRDTVDSAMRESREPAVAVPAPMPPAEIPGSMIYGSVRIGSLCPGATLYVDGAQRPIGRGGPVDINQLSGEVRLEVRTPAGARWDTTLTVESGQVYTIGNRPLRCR